MELPKPEYFIYTTGFIHPSNDNYPTKGFAVSPDIFLGGLAFDRKLFYKREYSWDEHDWPPRWAVDWVRFLWIRASGEIGRRARLRT